MRALLFFTLIMANAVFAEPSDVEYESLQKRFFTDIKKMKVCGKWRKTPGNGVYRIFEVDNNGTSNIFVDYLEREKTGYQLKNGYSIIEINNNNSYTNLSQIKCTIKDDQIAHISLKTTHQGEKDFKLTITVDGKLDNYIFNIQKHKKIKRDAMGRRISG